jgi:hypothetical protein
MSAFPIGLVMCFSTEKPHRALERITDFCKYGVDEFVEIRMRPYILTFPNDFRQAISANYDKVYDINGSQII